MTGRRVIDSCPVPHASIHTTTAASFLLALVVAMTSREGAVKRPTYNRQKFYDLYLKVVLAAPTPNHTHPDTGVTTQGLRHEARNTLAALALKCLVVLLPGERMSERVVDVMDRWVMEGDEWWRPRKGVELFESLELFAWDLIDWPWKKEFHQISMYSGYYKTRIELNCARGAERLFAMLGYERTADHYLRLRTSTRLQHSQLIEASFEFFIVSVEFMIQDQILEQVLREGKRVSARDVYRCRRTMRGSIESCVDYLLSDQVTEEVSRGSSSYDTISEKYYRLNVENDNRLAEKQNELERRSMRKDRNGEYSKLLEINPSRRTNDGNMLNLREDSPTVVEPSDTNYVKLIPNDCEFNSRFDKDPSLYYSEIKDDQVYECDRDTKTDRANTAMRSRTSAALSCSKEASERAKFAAVRGDRGSLATGGRSYNVEHDGSPDGRNFEERTTERGRSGRTYANDFGNSSLGQETTTDYLTSVRDQIIMEQSSDSRKPEYVVFHPTPPVVKDNQTARSPKSVRRVDGVKTEPIRSPLANTTFSKPNTEPLLAGTTGASRDVWKSQGIPDNFWQCSTCTFANDSDCVECKMCYTPRGVT